MEFCPTKNGLKKGLDKVFFKCAFLGSFAGIFENYFSPHKVILNLIQDLPHKPFMGKTTLSGRFRIGVRNDFNG